VDARTAVAEQLPGYRVDSVALLGEGQENVSYEVNGELIVRFSKETDPARRAAAVDREARLLTAVAGVSPVPVPVPVFALPEHGCLAYGKVPGRPLLELPRAEWTAHGTTIAATLAGLLAALHAVPADRLAGLVDPDDQSLVGWRDEAADLYATVKDEVPAAHHDAIAAFFAAPPPDTRYPLVFSHNDLGIEHVLVGPGTWMVTGVIDWTDAALVDPAYDFGLIHRDLGPAALDAAVRAYGAPVSRERAVFYARCSVFEDLAYGLADRRDRYVEKSRAALDWLFPGDT
jgi:aminoglycoside phosphotransferase (APT) family kinase protein